LAVRPGREQVISIRCGVSRKMTSPDFYRTGARIDLLIHGRAARQETRHDASLDIRRRAGREARPGGGSCWSACPRQKRSGVFRGLATRDWA
jgi:hypothetical protein